VELPILVTEKIATRSSEDFKNDSRMPLRTVHVRGATSASAVGINADFEQQSENVDGVGLDGGVQRVLEDPRHDSNVDCRRARTAALSTAGRQTVWRSGTRRPCLQRVGMRKFPTCTVDKISSLYTRKFPIHRRT